MENHGKMKNPDDIIRVGGVGTGRIFQHAHIRVYPKLWKQARLVGFFDINPERAQQARDKYIQLLEEYAAAHPDAATSVRENLGELKCHDSLDSLLEQADVIDVATFARGRMATAIAALEKGVHAMVEKPMARVWTEADRAARVDAANPDVFLQLSDDNVTDPKYLRLGDLFARQAIGRVHHFKVIRESSLNSTTVLKAQASAMDNGGGCLLDYGAHGLAGVWAALGLHLRPIKAEAVEIGVFFPHRVLEGEPVYMEVEDNAKFKVLFEDPSDGTWITVFMEASWSGGHIGFNPQKHLHSNNNMWIIGDKGEIHSVQETDLHVRRWDGGETTLPMLAFEGERISFDRLTADFFECVRTGTPPKLDSHFGAEIMAICGAVYLSAIRGRAVTLDEFKAYCRGFIEKYGDNEKADEAILTELLEPYKRKK
jgi:predicted dehydrogenase